MVCIFKYMILLSNRSYVGSARFYKLEGKQVATKCVGKGSSRSTLPQAQGADPMTPYTPQVISGIHQRLDRALEAELDRLASANPAHQQERYITGVRLVAGILRQLADEASDAAK